MRWETLDRDLEHRLPELSAGLDRERQLWAPDPPGQDIVLGDVLVPYVLQLMRTASTHSDELRRALAVVDDLAANPDPKLEWLAVISVLEALEDHPELLERSLQWLGPAARSRLPTREWVRIHADASRD